MTIIIILFHIVAAAIGTLVVAAAWIEVSRRGWNEKVD